MLKCKWAGLILVTSLNVLAGSNACLGVYSTQAKLTRVHSKPLEPIQFTGPVRKDLDRVITRTQDFDTRIQNMLAPFKRFEMEKMFFRYYDIKGNPIDLSFYRNANFLSETEFVVDPSVRGNSKHLVGVEYGYQNIHNDKVQTLGVIPSIELNGDGSPKRFYFYSQEQMKMFRSHFLGQPFSERMRTAILEINTAIFEHLAANPIAQSKVNDFERKRGWPHGMAKKLGLVYFSTDVLDLKQFAKSRKFSLEDMASAGWIKPYVAKNGTFSYRDNYDNSIKIPFYDEANPGQIAFWRTRNLDTRDGKPKYLSWPKDRSLYEDAPLFEEFYNSWNLPKAKGKRIVLTEGEFKCAIGEITTGVFHIGLPGIGQFQTSMLKKIIQAQPSEVIVLFDRDPIGKGLMRIDEVTDSQRASYLIAKRLESAGISVKVATLPDVYDGKKIGIDDLVLSHGPKLYLAALEQAVSADDYARLFGVDTTLSFLTDRKSKIKNALHRFDLANDLVAGTIELTQRESYSLLTNYLQMIDSALRFYIESAYPLRRQLNEPSQYFPIIRRGTDQSSVRIQSDQGEFDASSAFLKLTIAPKDAKICTMDSCFAINKTTREWARLSRGEKMAHLKAAIESIFPSDDYSYIENPTFAKKPFALLVLRKESRTPVALIERF